MRRRWEEIVVNEQEVECVRSIDIENAKGLSDYVWRKKLKLKYPDLRGDVTGPLLDQDYANRISLAKALLADIKKWPAKVIPIKRKKRG